MKHTNSFKIPCPVLFMFENPNSEQNRNYELWVEYDACVAVCDEEEHMPSNNNVCPRCCQLINPPEGTDVYCDGLERFMGKNGKNI
jgi:hypothetical protein